jgi:Domain of unknown function DUF302
MPPNDKGLIDIPSNHSVDETVKKLKGILQAKGITLFALVDHSGEAARAGIKMRPTKLFIFGNPKGGTSVMRPVARSIFLSRFWSGKTFREKFGSPTTAQVICSSDTTSRRSYCQTSRSSKHWRRKRRNNALSKIRWRSCQYSGCRDEHSKRGSDRSSE